MGLCHREREINVGGRRNIQQDSCSGEAPTERPTRSLKASTAGPVSIIGEKGNKRERRGKVRRRRRSRGRDKGQMRQRRRLTTKRKRDLGKSAPGSETQMTHDEADRS